MKFSMVSIDSDGLVRVASTGDLTSTDFGTEINPLRELIGPAWSKNKVLLELTKTQYMDSSAVGWLIKSHKEFKAGGGAFVIHSVQPAVRQVLDLLKIGKFIPIVDTEAAAREFAKGAA